MIDKRRLKKAFNRSASTYDRYAKIQKIVGEELVNIIRKLSIRPEIILDIGSGTGNISLNLHRIFPQAMIFGCDIALEMVKKAEAKKKGIDSSSLYFLVADGEKLPFKSCEFNLVVSSLTYQWFNNINSALQEVQRVLKHQGIFAFSLLGGDSMKELKYSYFEALRKTGCFQQPHFHRFLTEKTIQHLLEKNSFRNIQIQKDVKLEFHPNIKSIFFTLKAIGAQNASQYAPKGLGRKELFNWMTLYYEENYKTSSGFSLTYEVYYITAERG